MGVQFETYPTAIRGYIKYELPDKIPTDKSIDESHNYYTGQSKTSESLQNKLVSILGPKPFMTLVIDSETFPDVEHGQKLRILYYELRGISDAQAIEKFKSGKLTEKDATRLIEAGFVLPDDSSFITQHEMDAIYRYIESRNDIQMALLTHTEFIEDVFYQYAYYGCTPGYIGRLKTPARILGHNLYFDLGALAVSWKPATRDMAGGFTLSFCTCVERGKTCLRHLPIRYKRLGATKALYKFTHGSQTNAKGRITHKQFNGVFQDTMTLGASLTAGIKGNSLKSLCEIFDLPGKESLDDYNGPINNNYLRYLVNDVQQTFLVFRKQLEVLKMFNITERIEHIYSNASVDKRIRKQIGLEQGFAQRWSISDNTIGKTMTTYFGGRSEIGVRLKPTQVVCADFTSQYPATNYLMGLQELLFANDVKEVDATNEVISLLNNRNLLQLLQKKSTWKQLRCIVEIDGVPENKPAILPIRAQFGNEDYNIGTPFVAFNGKLYWTLADVIGSVLLTGNVPNITKAIRFVSVGRNPSLKPLLLGNGTVIDITNPDVDLYISLIGERHKIDAQAKRTKNKSEQIFLDAFQNGLKLIVNAGVYGVNEEFVVREHSTIKTPIDIFALGVTHRIGNKYDEPGPYNASVIGSLIPAGGRLLLAICERLLHDRGLHFVYCDTDSMAFAKPSNMTATKFYMLCDEIVEWFNSLSPYDKNIIPNFFKIEKMNYPLLGKFNPGSEQDIDKSNKYGIPLYAIAISAKRYVLYNKLPNGKYLLRKVSSHGTGQFDYRKYYRDKNNKTINWPNDIPWTKHDCADWIFIMYYYFVEAMEKGYHRNGEPVENGMYNPNFSFDELMDIPAYSQDSISHYSDLKQYAGLSHLRPGTFFTVLPRLITDLISSDINRHTLVTDKINSPDELYTKAKQGKIYFARSGEPMPSFQVEFLTTLGAKLASYFTHKEVKAELGEQETLVGKLNRRHVRIPDILIVVGKEITGIANTLERGNAIAMLSDNITIANSQYCRTSISGNIVPIKYRQSYERKMDTIKISRGLSSLFTRYSMSDLLLATCIPRRTLFDLQHSIISRTAYPRPATSIKLTEGLELLNAERDGGSLFEWRQQIKHKNITTYRLANKLGITIKQMNNLWNGQATWTIELRNKIMQILDVENTDND